MSVAGLVLAAGEGRRLGRPKAALELGGRRLVDRAVAVLADGGCDPVLVVTGAADVGAVPRAQVVANPGWRSGMGSSLRTGLAALPADVTACVVLLVDMPGVGVEAVRRVVAAHRSGAAVAVATYGGRRGHPVLLGRGTWAQAAGLATGDTGARALLGARPEVVVDVACDGTGVPHDIDTADQLRAAAARMAGEPAVDSLG